MNKDNLPLPLPLFLSLSLPLIWIVSILSLIFSSPQSYIQGFGDFYKSIFYISTFISLSFFQSSSKIQVSVYRFTFIHFHSMALWSDKTYMTNYFFCIVD